MTSARQKATPATTDRRRANDNLWLLAALAPSFMALCLAWSAKSVVPVVLGRYSVPIFAFNVAFTLLHAAAALSILRQRWFAAPAVAGLMISSLLLQANNALVVLPAIVPLSYAARLSLSVFAVGIGALCARQPNGRRNSEVLLVVGAAFFTLTMADLALQLMLRPTATQSPGQFAFRAPMDLTRIKAEDISVIGDSFVWGQGVAKEEAFPARLETLLRDHGFRGKVHNLGIIGADTTHYLAVLRSLPPVGRVVVCIYMNDMRPRETVASRMQQALISVGRSSLSFKLVSDVINTRLFPSVDDYTAGVVMDYDRSDPSFARRWEMMREDIYAMASLARRTGQTPLLVVFPLMVDFSRYPLVQAHRDLEAVGVAAGFAVVDLLDSFARRYGDGRRFWAAPNDNHFNAVVHRTVAADLLPRLGFAPEHASAPFAPSLPTRAR